MQFQQNVNALLHGDRNHGYGLGTYVNRYKLHLKLLRILTLALYDCHCRAVDENSINWKVCVRMVKTQHKSNLEAHNINAASCNGATL